MLSGDAYFNMMTIVSIKDPLTIGSETVLEIGAPFEMVEQRLGKAQSEDTPGSKMYLLKEPQQSWGTAELVFYPQDGTLHQITLRRQ